MIQTYESAESESESRSEVRGADPAALAAAAHTARRYALLAIWIWPFAYLGFHEHAAALRLDPILDALAGAAVSAQAFRLWERRSRFARRLQAGARLSGVGGLASFTAVASAAAVAAACLAQVLLRPGDAAVWVLVAACAGFCAAGLCLERSGASASGFGYAMGLCACAVLLFGPSALTRAHLAFDAAGDGFLGVSAIVAGALLRRARHGDEWEAHLGRMRLARERDLAPGQEPDGPQDALPVAYAQAAEARDRRWAAVVAAEAERRARRSGLAAGILVADLVICVLGHRLAEAIDQRGVGAESAAVSHSQGVQIVQLGVAACVVLLALGVVAARARSGTVVWVQGVAILCTALATAVVAWNFFGVSGSGPAAPAGPGGGDPGVCYSQGHCTGKAAQEG